MKTTFLKSIKVVALALALTVATSGVIFANGAGAPPTTKVSANGAGNGAGGSTTWNKKRKKRVARRIRRRANRQTARA